MIVRSVQDEWWCVTQIDHARLAGLLVAAWRWEHAPPSPSTMRAITFHDVGWYDDDARPEWNPASGGPYAFTELPFHPRRLEAHRRAIDWMTGLDPYAGYLLSRHRTGLRRGRYGATPSHQRPGRTMAAEEAAFLDAEDRRQADLLRTWGWDQRMLDADYRLLQVADLWSMYLCLGAPKPTQVVTAGPVGEWETFALQLEPGPAGEVAVSPWPFERPRLTVPIWTRRLPKAEVRSAETLEACYYAAVPEVVEMHLCPG